MNLPLGGRCLFVLAALLDATVSLAAQTGLPAIRRVEIAPDKPCAIAFDPVAARFVRLVLHANTLGDVCLDELEIYGPDGKSNLALASLDAKASASSCLSGYAIHQIAHLNDGQYGNDHSWIAAAEKAPWAQIELPLATAVAKVVFSRDRKGQFKDRIPTDVEVLLSNDGSQWKSAGRIRAPQAFHSPSIDDSLARNPLPEPLTFDGLVRSTHLWERDAWGRMSHDDPLSPHRADRAALKGQASYWAALVKLSDLDRTLRQMDDMLDRLAAQGLDVAEERSLKAGFIARKASLPLDLDQREEAEQALYLDVRLAKRRLMFRDPALAALARLTFVKRHPLTPSHNYSDILDSAFRGGGGVCVLDIPSHGGRLEPSDGRLTVLFDAAHGIARDAAVDFSAQRIYFAYRPGDADEGNAYWHLMVMRADGSELTQLTSGPFHDYYPCPLPDGGLSFISTRCKSRFLCWRPQALVLFRMDADGGNLQPLSHANLTEWAPAAMRDGRILWTRSEYLDKGADFGHTLWAIRPDGSHPVMLFGNNTNNCYANAREVPGASELSCTLISHGGDLNGPVGLVDIGSGPRGIEAVTNITPDTTPQYHMSWAQKGCFRDPVPIGRDYFVVSHAPGSQFGIYVIDRFGNREVLYFDPAISSMCPTPLAATERPPVLGAAAAPATEQAMGQFTVADVYQGIEPTVARGRVKYLRVCQELRADAQVMPDGQFRRDYDPFQDFYAAPTHKVFGPSGWPTYVAKAALGTTPVEEDGSVNFLAPANKVLYFQLLDEKFNELQRMRSVVQLQPGETRGCVGCHESRVSAPPPRPGVALRREPSALQPPPWGAKPFSYEAVVQPVLDDHCVRCHAADDAQKLDLRGVLDAERIPASYRTLITQGWVHYFDMTWGQEHKKAEPLSFGSVKSKLWTVLDAGHHDVHLTAEETHRVKCWIDLNCPLWPDYRFRLDRPEK